MRTYHSQIKGETVKIFEIKIDSKKAGNYRDDHELSQGFFLEAVSQEAASKICIEEFDLEKSTSFSKKNDSSLTNKLSAVDFIIQEMNLKDFNKIKDKLELTPIGEHQFWFKK